MIIIPIPIPVIWTKFTATLEGRVIKLVPCENCQTEYVYTLERDGTSSCTSIYEPGDKDTQNYVISSAEETLRDYLTNDFDPVPCPVCGHYQKYMYPKLLESQSLSRLAATILVLLVTGFSAILTLYWGIQYLDRPNEHALWRLLVAGCLLVVVGLIGARMSAVQRERVRRFDPNTEAQHVRIEKGRSRAVTRSEFEATQRPVSP